MVNNLADVYLRHYQSGSGLPYFRGSDLQYGSGFGNVLRSVARFLVPLFTGAATKFISSTADGLTQGKSLKQAATQSIAPTLNETVGTLGTKLQSKLQGGSGRKRKGTKKNKRVKRRRVYKEPKFNFPNRKVKLNYPKIKTNF